MRARADRLEAALGPAEPPKPARPQYDRADWPKRARLSIRGAIGTDNIDDRNGTGGGEFAFPLTEIPFDIAVRGSFFRYINEKREYVSSRRLSVNSIKKQVFELIGWAVWHPFRGEIISPHVGVGLGYQHITGDKDAYHLRKESYYWYSDWNDRNSASHHSLDNRNLTLAGRVGATLTYKRFTLKGEFILTSETKALLAEVGLRIWEHLVLNGLVERYDVDLSDSCTAFGGGITILF